LLIFPAVDIKEGRCVRLIQGKKDQETVYGHDPVIMAKEWERQGASWVHVVDLDGAFSGIPRNREIIRKMVAVLSIPVQLGGGIREYGVAREYLELGVTRLIIGTGALNDQPLMRRLLDDFGPERIMVGIDAREGMVAVKGWEDVSTVAALDLAQDMKSLGVTRMVYTDISRDGLMQGPNFEAMQVMASVSGLAVIASGGVSTVEDILRLKEIPGIEGAIIGKSLYEGRLSLEAALNVAKG